jgi:hypothetical protein
VTLDDIEKVINNSKYHERVIMKAVYGSVMIEVESEGVDVKCDKNRPKTSNRNRTLSLLVDALLTVIVRKDSNTSSMISLLYT